MWGEGGSIEVVDYVDRIFRMRCVWEVVTGSVLCGFVVLYCALYHRIAVCFVAFCGKVSFVYSFIQCGKRRHAVTLQSLSRWQA